MLFFLLLNAAPAMCHPSCNDDYSSRKIWLEIDSQILNALFCVTGFGLAPWRFRDFYWMVRCYSHDQHAMRRLDHRLGKGAGGIEPAARRRRRLHSQGRWRRPRRCGSSRLRRG